MAACCARSGSDRDLDEADALFTYADGRPIRAEYLSHRLQQFVRKLDQPPIRRHDLRQGAATLALAAHMDLKVIQQMLGPLQHRHLHKRPARGYPRSGGLR